MANSCSTDHNCKFNNNIVHINVAKSAPSAPLTIYKKSMYPPKVGKKPPFWRITRNLPTISLFGPRGMETSHFTANRTKFAQFSNHNGEPHEIRVILANIYHSLFFSVPQTFTANSQNLPNSQILKANHAELTHFALILINLSFFF